MAKETAPNGAEEESDGVRINRLSAAMRVPGIGRRNTLFLGWTPEGIPALSWDAASLGSQAKESFSITRFTEFPLDAKFGSLPIVPVQYLTFLRSIDRNDTDDAFTQDILTIAVANASGATVDIKISELSLMAAIIKGHTVWEDVNTKTILADRDVMPTSNMHTVFLPAQDADDNPVLYAVLFQPPMENESNETAFRVFLTKTIQALIALDERQPAENKKGYESVLREKQTQSVVGGDAYVIMKALSDLNLVTNMTKERLERIWRESAGQSFTNQLLLVGREFGLVNFEVKDAPVETKNLNTASIDVMLGLLSDTFDVVSQRFKKGK